MLTWVLPILVVATAAAQMGTPWDASLARQYFEEARALCERDGGRLWGVSLCGPIAIGDPITKSIATSEPMPAATAPAVLGFANAALDWGGTRWSILSWPTIPRNPQTRGRLLIHELFHRVQPQLGLLVADRDNPHLDTVDGRYWLQLEWRALAAALRHEGASRTTAIADALAFRLRRREMFASAESERILEITEGLAQYTGTVVAAGTTAAAVADAIDQLAQAEKNETFVRTFPYPLGAAYGLLLDVWAPAWRQTIKAADDLGAMLAASAKIAAAPDVEAAAQTYGAADLRASELKREQDRRERLADLRRRFVDGPVLVLPVSRTNAYTTSGMTPLPGHGIVYPSFRSTADWGSLEAAEALLAADRSIRVPGPVKVDGTTITGPGWAVTVAEGWTVRAGPRPGDLMVMRDRQGRAGAAPTAGRRSRR
jgi:hypothetical protein